MGASRAYGRACGCGVRHAHQTRLTRRSHALMEASSCDLINRDRHPRQVGPWRSDSVRSQNRSTRRDTCVQALTTPEKKRVQTLTDELLHERRVCDLLSKQPRSQHGALRVGGDKKWPPLIESLDVRLERVAHVLVRRVAAALREMQVMNSQRSLFRQPTHTTSTPRPITHTHARTPESGSQHRKSRPEPSVYTTAQRHDSARRIRSPGNMVVGTMSSSKLSEAWGELT